MKFTIIVLVLLLLILGLGIFELVYLNNTFTTFTAKMEEFLEKNQNDSLSVADIDNVLEFWNEKKKVLHLFINHAEISNIDNNLFLAKGYLENERFFDAESSLMVVYETVKDIMFNFGFNIQNLI